MERLRKYLEELGSKLYDNGILEKKEELYNNFKKLGVTINKKDQIYDALNKLKENVDENYKRKIDNIFERLKSYSDEELKDKILRLTKKGTSKKHTKNNYFPRSNTNAASKSDNSSDDLYNFFLTLLFLICVID